MKSKRITFTGSYDNKPIRESIPGECIRMVNLRKHNNALQPPAYQMPVGNMADPSRRILYLHNCNGVQHLISYKGKEIYHEATINNGTTSTVNELITTLSSIVADVNSIGNTLIITSATEVQYAFQADGHYKKLGAQPPMPIIRFEAHTADNIVYKTDEIVHSGLLSSLSEAHYTAITNNVLGIVNKITHEIHQEHYFVMPLMVRYALRMYDGSHIMPSAPVIIYSNNYQYNIENDFNLIMEYLNANNETTQKPMDIGFFKVAIAYTIDAIDLSDWEDIITGIDIFVSREIPVIEERTIDYGTYLKIREDEGTYAHYCYSFQYPFYSRKEIERSALEESLFYPLHEIDLRNVVAGECVTIDNKCKYEEIMHREPLIIDTSNLCPIGAKKSYIYNNRLHLADITQHYYEGYPIQLYSTSADAEAADAVAYIRTDIRLPNGGVKQAIALSKIPHFNYRLSALLSYPDSNARTMKVVIRHNGYEYSQSFGLQAVPNENRAAYINEQILDFDVSTWDKTAITQENVNKFPYESSAFSVEQHNRMIVSELNNPFFFPSELSYYISNGTITGIASATTAISQGQYGLFPLYVFTNEGIWCMHVGSGNICYERTTPISNIQVRPSSPIIAIEQAIVFLADSELYIISGSQCKVLLPLTELAANEFNSHIGTILTNASPACTDNILLQDYISGAASAVYRQDLKEIIFCNESFTYSLVLHLPTGHLYRWERNFLTIAGNSLIMLAQYRNGFIFNIYNKSDAISSVCLISQPITNTNDTFVRLRQVVWRMQGASAAITLLITASHEPDYNNIVIHKALFNGCIDGHLTTNILSAPYKYYRLILIGDVSPDFTLDGVDIAYDVIENNRLR